MENITLYRKRFIPNETILLKDDKIISCDNDKIITSWNVLKPRNDFTHGTSCYFLNDGFKVSKFIDKNDNLLYWYCDIIDFEYFKTDNKYVFSDLLIDVIVYPDGFVKVLDMDEIADALDMNLISIDIVKKSLKRTNKLLKIIYDGNFDNLRKYIMEV